MILIWTIFVAWRNLFACFALKSSNIPSNFTGRMHFISVIFCGSNFPTAKRDSFLLIAIIGKRNKKNLYIYYIYIRMVIEPRPHRPFNFDLWHTYLLYLLKANARWLADHQWLYSWMLRRAEEKKNRHTVFGFWLQWKIANQSISAVYEKHRFATF